MGRVSRISLCLLLLGGFSVVEAAEVYKWKDRKNITTYSQLPPERGVLAQRLRTTGSDARTIDTPAALSGSAPRSAAVDSKAAKLTPAQIQARAQLDVQEKTRMAKLAQERTDQCTRAHGQFDQLTQHPRMRVQDPSGKIRVMPEDERQKLLGEVKGRIVDFCVDQ